MTAAHRQVISFFFPQSKVTTIKPLGGGLVNDSWQFNLQSGKKYVLQRLNPSVFSNPMAVQNNLLKVTQHIHAQLPTLNHYPHQKGREFILFHPVSDQAGNISYKDNAGVIWRVLTYIDQTCSLRSISSPDQAEEIGTTLGLFHQLLADLPLDALTDPLPGFHNTPGYLEQYEQILAGSHNSEVVDCQDFIKQHQKDAFLLENAHELSQQVIHADPKVANFLFSSDKERVVSLVDLDTVRPGLLLHDIGDCLRSCCNPLGEEVKNQEDVLFRKDYFAATIRGYLAIAADLLTPEDKHLLINSAWLISFELGLRFYSDYLINNCYFKVDYPEQNLFRARIQFALAHSIEQQYDRLCAIIQ